MSAPADLVPGRPIAGPRALSGDAGRVLALTRTLAVLDFKLRFFGSSLGYLWQLIRPLLLFGVLYVVFTQIVDISGTADFYAVVLLSGIVLFRFFADATSGALTCVLDKEALVRKVSFPRMAVPMSVVLGSTFNLGLNAVAVLVFAIAGGVGLHASIWQLVPLLVLLSVFTSGASLLLSALYVRFRDLAPIWEVTVQVLFYASPVLWPVESVGNESLRQAVMVVNPLAPILEQVRHAVIDPSAPSAAQAAGGAAWLAIPLATILVTAVVGFLVFDRSAPRIAEEL